MQIAGAVLAGGASSRMGRTKALVEVDGRPMARIVADALAGAGCAPVALVGGSETELEPLGLDVIPDQHPGDGPLGGVITALCHFTGATHVLVAACDLPHLDTTTVAAMVEAVRQAPSAHAIVADSGRLEPGLVVWPRSALRIIDEAFESGTRAMHEMLSTLDIVRQSVDATTLRNVNRPGDVPRSGRPGQ